MAGSTATITFYISITIAYGTINLSAAAAGTACDTFPGLSTYPLFATSTTIATRHIGISIAVTLAATSIYRSCSIAVGTLSAGTFVILPSSDSAICISSTRYQRDNNKERKYEILHRVIN